MRSSRNWVIFLWYLTLSLLVFGPLLKPGYILTLDMVFTPAIRMPTADTNSYLLQAALHAANYAIPSYVVEKLLLVGILLLAGMGMHRLMLTFAVKFDRYQRIGAYVAGTLFVINPFTYDRLMAGQYDVLFGFALLPWFTSTLVTFLKQPTKRDSVILAVWAVIISIVSIHSIGFIAILAAIATILAFRQHHKDTVWLHKLFSLGLLSLSLFVLASCYWLVPLIIGHGNTAASISSFSASDMNAFATVGNNWLEKLGNVLQLRGFWLERRDMYHQPQNSLLLGSLLMFFIWGIALAGAITMWREKQRSIVILFTSCTVIAALVATGPLNSWLATYIPFFSGYREPQKFVALITLSLAVFVGHGVAVLMKYAYEKGSMAFLSFSCAMVTLLPAVWTPTLWWGLNDQLSPVWYPADWYTVNQQLDNDHENFETLFLPWHLYIYFDFTNRIIVNPAPSFFDKPIIISDNPEYKNASLSDSTIAKRQLDRLLPHADTQRSLGAQLASLNIKYVIVDKDDDFINYAYLRNQHNLKLLMNSATLEVYVNTAWSR